jgi:hypothetical protein
MAAMNRDRGTLYEKVSEKIDELISKSPKMELDMESLKRNLPNKMRLTRYDVINVVKELETDGLFKRHGNKLKRRCD